MIDLTAAIVRESAAPSVPVKADNSKSLELDIRSRGNLIQRLDWHGCDIGHTPSRRHPHFVGSPPDALREYVAHDCHNPPVAIDHRCSRRAVIDDQAILALINLQERHACELSILAQLNEPAFDWVQATSGISESHDLLLRQQRLLASCDAAGAGNAMLKFYYRQLLCLGSRYALDACGNELAAISVCDLERLPVFRRELHCRRHVFGGDERRWRQEPTGAAHANEVWARFALDLSEIMHNADGRVRKLGRIDASCVGKLRAAERNGKSQHPAINASLHSRLPMPTQHMEWATPLPGNRADRLIRRFFRCFGNIARRVAILSQAWGPALTANRLRNPYRFAIWSGNARDFTPFLN